jgi:DNA-binding protein Fis
MTNNVKDTVRALAAAKAIIDGRNPFTEYSSVLVTAEHAFAVVLLACMGGDARKAAAMLNEGLVQGIEERLALYASKGGAA